MLITFPNRTEEKGHHSGAQDDGIIVLAGTRTLVSRLSINLSPPLYISSLAHGRRVCVYTIIYTCNRIKRSRIERTRAAYGGGGNPMDSKDFSLLFSTWQRNDVHKLCVRVGYLCYSRTPVGPCDHRHRHHLRRRWFKFLSLRLTMHAHAYNDVCQVTRTPHNAIWWIIIMINVCTHVIIIWSYMRIII